MCPKKEYTKGLVRVGAWLILSLILSMLTVAAPDRVDGVSTLYIGTEVGGPITSDTTWTRTHSPYVVVEDIEVWEGVTLTIEPGVVVKFGGGKRLQVDGGLFARGTAEDLISFTSSQAVPALGDWGNIEFTSTAITTTMDVEGNYVSGSILQYCLVEYARGDVFSATASSAIYAHSLLIDHCIVRNNNARGIYNVGTTDAPARITNNTVRGNSVISSHSCSGAYGGGIYSSFGVVKGNTVDGNSVVGRRDCDDTYGGGIYASNSTVSDNAVNENTITGNPIIFRAYGGGIYASGSIVTGNSVNGNLTSSHLFSYGGGIYAVDSTVANNAVMGNSTSGSNHTRGGGICASNSTLRGNSVSDNSTAANLAAYGGGIYASESSLSENTLNGNSAAARYPANGQGHGGGVYISGGAALSNTIATNSVAGDDSQGSGAYVYGVSDFLYNTVISNSGPLAKPVGGVGIDGAPQVHHNNFNGNLPHDVVVISSDEVSGSQNYWGTVLNMDILEQVYDGSDDGSRGRFLYTPYLWDLSPKAPFPSPVGLMADYQGNRVTLSWGAAPGFAPGWGYKVYYDVDSPLPPYTGTGLDEGSSPISVGDVTSSTLTGLGIDDDYYFAITSDDGEGHESHYSNVIWKQGGYRVFLPAIVVHSRSANFMIYDDALGFDWHNWSWGSVNLENSGPVRDGPYSIAVDLGPHQGLSFWHPYFDTQSYSRLEFYIHGGTVGGQRLDVFLHDDMKMSLPGVSLNNPAYLEGGTVEADVWKRVSIPLTDIGMVPGQSTLTLLTIIDATGGTQPTFFVDDVQLVYTGDQMKPVVKDSACLGAEALALTFSEKVAGAALAANYRIVSDEDENYATPRPPKTAQYSEPTHVVYLIPPQPLQAGLTYSITVDGVVDLVGNRLGPGTTARLTARSLNINIDVGSVQRSIPSTLLGSNGAIWNPMSPTNDDVVDKVRASGATVMRFPGGSVADVYHWRDYEPEFGGIDQPGTINTSEFMAFATATNIEPMITVNFGTGTAAEAADWVRFLNITHTWDVKYWEIGNELYGRWEVSWTHDPVAYMQGDATHDGANAFCQAMKAVDPSIQVGVVGTNDPAAYAGWGPAVLQESGDCIDFYIVHYYSFAPGYSDYTGLLSAPHHPTEGPAVIATAVREMMEVYAPDRSLALALTEHTSYWGSPEALTIQTVHALYLADIMGQIVASGYDYANQWNMINVTSPNGGDHGCLLVDQANYRQPSYYVFPLWSRFGDQLLAADVNLDPVTAFNVYSGRHSATGIVTILTVNKTGVTITATVTLNDASPSGPASVYMVRGESLDAASVAYNGETDPPVDLVLIPPDSLMLGSATFDVSFPPYSLMLLEIPTE